jgi:hypothetical protein
MAQSTSTRLAESSHPAASIFRLFQDLPAWQRVQITDILSGRDVPRMGAADDTALVYAMAHQLATRRREGASVDWSWQWLKSSPAIGETPAGRVMVVDEGTTGRDVDNQKDRTRVPLIQRFDGSIEACSAGQAVIDGLALACELGYAGVVGPGAGLVIVLQNSLDGQLGNFSAPWLPASLYINAFSPRLTMADGLIHECIHSCLNQYQLMKGLNIPDGERFFSPWRGEPRRPFGFVHGVVVFAVLATMYSRALESEVSQLTPVERGWARHRLGRETRNLIQTHDNLRKVLGLIGDPELADAVQDLLAQAVVRGDRLVSVG